MPQPDDVPERTAEVVRTLVERGLTVAAAESLTGGGLMFELTRVPGASTAVLGGVVVYATALKHTLLGVDAELLAAEGPVHPDVARQLAAGVRERLAVEGRPADLGVATTGVAGPDPQGGRAVGTVFVGVSSVRGTRAVELTLDGDRAGVRAQTVSCVIEELAAELGFQPGGPPV